MVVKHWNTFYDKEWRCFQYVVVCQNTLYSQGDDQFRFNQSFIVNYDVIADISSKAGR